MNYLQKKKQALLNYVSSGGGRLPSEYQEVEWIQGTNSGRLGSHIQIDYTPTINTRLKLVIMPITDRGFNIMQTGRTTGYYQYVFGVMSDNARRFTGTINQTTNYSPGFITANELYTLELSKDYFIVNDVDYATTPFPTDDFNARLLPVGALYADVAFAGIFKIYECKLWESGNLERDLVPCYRKADDVIGLYDTVTQTFYTNAGTGTFTKGQDV